MKETTSLAESRARSLDSATFSSILARTETHGFTYAGGKRICRYFQRRTALATIDHLGVKRVEG
jgi:hypothetical protein